MKHLAQVLTAFCLVALAIIGGPADAKPENDLHIGEPREFQLEGNPSTGYTWQLDGAASDGLDLVELKPLGYASRKKERPVVVGAPAPFLVRLTCVKPGHADLWFVYVGPSGKRSANRQEVRVHCE
jgi:inhibitor of cysteine peptidase